jgi:hypothetical protein
VRAHTLHALPVHTCTLVTAGVAPCVLQVGCTLSTLVDAPTLQFNQREDSDIRRLKRGDSGTFNRILYDTTSSIRDTTQRAVVHGSALSKMAQRGAANAAHVFMEELLATDEELAASNFGRLDEGAQRLSAEGAAEAASEFDPNLFGTGKGLSDVDERCVVGSRSLDLWVAPSLAAGCWLLAAGCWLLAAGCWLLAAGCWLLRS